MRAIRPHYLDACAIVKLLVDEQGSSNIRAYFHENTNFYTTSLCFVETLGALKQKYFFQKRISKEEYLNACDALMAHVSGGSIGIDEIKIATIETYKEVERIAKIYDLDIADAFQVVTLKQGIFSIFAAQSKPLLITADYKLADAVKREGEGLKVWNIMETPRPES